MFGIDGWRCAFHLVALVSIVTSVMTMWLAVDPRKKLAVSHVMPPQAWCSHRLLTPCKALVSMVTSVMTMWLAVDPQKKLAVSHL